MLTKVDIIFIELSCFADVRKVVNMRFFEFADANKMHILGLIAKAR